MSLGSMLRALALASLALGAVANEATHRYKVQEEVTLWANKIGPYHNPQETYSFYSIPFCQPNMGKELKHKWDGLGSILEGNELVDSGLHINFKVPVAATRLCDVAITAESAEEFLYAVENHYWFQMYLDELPIWGMVGELSNTEEAHHIHPIAAKVQWSSAVAMARDAAPAYLYTHKSFSIAYNGDQIVQVNLTSEVPKPIRKGEVYAMTYSVKWVATSAPFAKRFDIYLDTNFFEHQIHWFSIFNSFMMVIFLCGLVALILMRTLRNDYQKYSAEADELDLDRVIDESGWKQVHGDVFRAPSYLMLFCAVIGTGAHLALLLVCVLCLAIASSLYITRGGTLTATLVCYALTSFAGGYVSASTFKRHGGERWKSLMVIVAVLFPTIVFSLVLSLNTIAVLYASSAAIPFTTMLAVFALWLFISLPLTVGGTLLGRNLSAAGDFPCRVNQLRRPIPEGRWLVQPWLIGLLGGILPFGSIFIEMYFVFTSFWNYKFYYVYGFMLLVFVILMIVTVCVTIVSTYFLLNSEDYRWQWTTFFSGASTAIYVYLYSIYYFFFKTFMFGFFQTTFYFGYTFLFCVGMFLLCGAVGHLGSAMFVHRIYQNIKSD